MERFPSDIQKELQRYLPRDDPLPLGAVPNYPGTYLGLLPKDPRVQLQSYVRRCAKVQIEVSSMGVRIYGEEIPDITLIVSRMQDRGSTIEEFQVAVEEGNEGVEHYLNPKVSLSVESPEWLGVHVEAAYSTSRYLPFITIPACYELLDAIATVEKRIALA